MRIARLVVPFMCCLIWASSGFAANDGYEGLIAPSTPDPVVSAPQSPQPQSSPSVLVPAPDMSPRVGYEQPFLPKTKEELAAVAAVYDVQKTPLRVELTKEERAGLSAKRSPQPMQMSSIEYMIEKNIQDVMEMVNDTRVSDAVHAQNVKIAKATMTKLTNGLRQKASIPDNVYRDMGASDQYIAEKKENATKALARAEEALKVLMQYR